MIIDLEELRWTGRKGYGSRVLLGACLAKTLYAIPTWTRTVRLIEEHEGLARAIGGTPSEWACYRFTLKLRVHAPLLAACLDRVLTSLQAALPELGVDVAIDGSDLPAYANGQRYLSKGGRERERFSDPDASWGHRSSVSTRKGGGFYGYKIHAVVCSRTGLPVAWRIESGRVAEFTPLEELLDEVTRRGLRPETVALDKGYDFEVTHTICADRRILPIIALRMTSDVLRDPYNGPACEHGPWTFAGADFGRNATKWRCPTGECQPKSCWVKASRRRPLVPRSTRRWRRLYKGRASVEREFGRLKHEYALTPLRVRGLGRVQLHADLTILARLSQALARARPMPLAA